MRVVRLFTSPLFVSMFDDAQFNKFVVYRFNLHASNNFLFDHNPHLTLVDNLYRFVYPFLLFQRSRYPKSIAFIVSNEFCERFSFYGMKSECIFILTDVFVIHLFINA